MSSTTPLPEAALRVLDRYAVPRPAWPDSGAPPAGHDTDTIASMAGNLVGACVGADRMRQERRDWWDELEGRDELLSLADGLLEVALQHRSRS